MFDFLLVGMRERDPQLTVSRKAKYLICGFVFWRVLRIKCARV